ncbi:MAG: hypothetical protein OEN55_13075 [Alphaproteobacteria bacterium]|nr:hypothetical protein [Alphaproteobacteria bacterium]
MLRRIFLPIALIFVAGEPATAAPDDDFLIVPGESVGKITGDASENHLRAIYGADRVKPTLVDQGEGFVCRGSRILFGAGETLEVTWLDAEARSGVEAVHVKGRRWNTSEGIHLGVTLKELESINGTPFQLAGFGVDYAGTITSWEDGRLDSFTGRVWLSLAPTQEDYERIPINELLPVMGDGVDSSAHPIMQRLNPRLVKLVVRLAQDKLCDSFFPE